MFDDFMAVCSWDNGMDLSLLRAGLHVAFERVCVCVCVCVWVKNSVFQVPPRLGKNQLYITVPPHKNRCIISLQ